MTSDLETAIGLIQSDKLAAKRFFSEFVRDHPEDWRGHFYLAACLRWAQLYPRGAPLIAGHEIPARLCAPLRLIENRPAVIKAFADEHIGGRPLTMPEPPDLPPDEVTG